MKICGSENTFKSSMSSPFKLTDVNKRVKKNIKKISLLAQKSSRPQNGSLWLNIALLKKSYLYGCSSCFLIIVLSGFNICWVGFNFGILVNLGFEIHYFENIEIILFNALMSSNVLCCLQLLSYFIKSWRTRN